MKVLVVCRYNQARSIVIGAMIRKLFPQIDVVTAGIEAPHGKGIPGSTEALCREWNLPQFDRISIAIEKLEIEHFDAVLA